MSTPDIKAFFRLAHQHFDALEALFNAREGMREAELRSRLDDDSPHTASAGHVFRELQANRLIEPRPAETASFELTPTVRDLFREFRRKQKLSTPNVIKTYLDRLEELMERLEDRVGQPTDAGVRRVLEDIDTEIEQIRTLSRSNREAVLNRVTELRAETRSNSVRERFRMINELLEDYVTPLKNIVQNRGAFETLFSELRTALSEAQASFSDNPSMARTLASTDARLQRVRRAVLDNFEAARQEITRLYEQHETNSEILKGASSLLNRVHHEGAGALELTDKMKLASFTMRTVFQDEGLSSYLQLNLSSFGALILQIAFDRWTRFRIWRPFSMTLSGATTSRPRTERSSALSGNDSTNMIACSTASVSTCGGTRKTWSTWSRTKTCSRARRQRRWGFS